MRRISEKRRAEADERWDVRQFVLTRDKHRCQAKPKGAPGECGGHLDVHEVVQRSVRPGVHLEPDLCLAVCRRHHDWISDNIDAANRLGLLLHSWEVPPPANSKIVPRR